MATILTKKSDTASAVPLAADLTNAAGGAELAVNATDKRLFSKTSGGTVVELGTNPSSLTLPNGTANGLAFLNASKVVTSGSALTFDGTNLKVQTATARANITTDADLVSQNGLGILATSTTYGQGYQYVRFFNSSASYTGSISHTASTGIGLYSASDLILGANSAEGMRLTSTGLGIGTSSPSNKLHVVSTTSDTPFRSDTSVAYNFISLVNSTGNAFIGSNGNNLIFQPAGTTQLTLNNSGNLGLGVTPSAWQSGARAQQIGATYSLALSAFGDDSSITTNAFYNTSSNWVYQNTASSYKPTRYNQYLGNHIWSVAASTGTAGSTITWSESARIDSSGRFLIGTTNSGGNKLAISDGAGDTTSYGSVQVVRASSSGTSWHYSGVANGADICGFGFNSSNTAIFGQGNNPNTPNAYVAAGLIGGSNNLVFGTSGAERARIDSSGRFLVGTTSNVVAGAGHFSRFNADLTSQFGIGVSTTQTTGSGYFVNFVYNGSQIGSINTTAGTVTLYNTTSDQRLKENIVDAPEFGNVIDSIKVRSYDWKSDGTHQRAGFVAQELITVAPEAVHQPVDAEQMMAVDYSKLVPMLVKEVQSLRKRLADAGL